MTKQIDNSYIGDDGFKYVLINDDFGYIRESPEVDKSRLYFEAYELEKTMLKNVKESGLNDPTLSFCLFSILIARVERILND